MGGLIGEATTKKDGLAPMELIPYEYNKGDNIVGKLSINTTAAGHIHSSILTICGVNGESLGIYLIVNKWNETKVSVKAICGSTSLGGIRLYYAIESNGNVSIYIKSAAYFRIFISPINARLNPIITSVESLPPEVSEISIS